jgi:hypothetical protein
MSLVIFLGGCCSTPNVSYDVYSISCNQTANDLKIKIQSITSLRSEAPIKAKKTITWLEQMAGLDVSSLRQLQEYEVCSTDKIKQILEEADLVLNE